MEKEKRKVDALLERAANSNKSEDAMRFSQSALNCAHALQVLSAINTKEK